MIAATTLDAIATAGPRLTADELVAEAVRCIITGREFPEHLRAPSAISPGLASVHDRIALLLSGPVGL